MESAQGYVTAVCMSTLGRTLAFCGFVSRLPRLSEHDAVIKPLLEIDSLLELVRRAVVDAQLAECMH